uniref:PH domain-containing protein n=1 Tax=Rhabditophanes sp. KR3021 TaxID=114890 RepID=A0AC35TUU3_9BILA
MNNISIIGYCDDNYTCSKNLRETCFMPPYKDIFDEDGLGMSPAGLYGKIFVRYTVNKLFGKKKVDISTMPTALTTCGRLLLYVDTAKGFILNVKKVKKVTITKDELADHFGINIKFSFGVVTLVVEEHVLTVWSSKLCRCMEGKKLKPLSYCIEENNFSEAANKSRCISEQEVVRNTAKRVELPNAKIDSTSISRKQPPPRRIFNFKSPLSASPLRRCQSEQNTPLSSRKPGMDIHKFIEFNARFQKTVSPKTIHREPIAEEISTHDYFTCEDTIQKSVSNYSKRIPSHHQDLLDAN